MYITADFLVIWSLTVLVLRPPRIKVPLRDADSAFDRRAPLVGRKTIEASPDHSGSPVAHRRAVRLFLLQNISCSMPRDRQVVRLDKLEGKILSETRRFSIDS